MKSIGTDAFPFVEFTLGPVLGGERTRTVDDLYQLGGSHGLVGVHARVILACRRNLFGHGPDGLLIKKRTLSVALEKNGFDLFSA